jgi:hypothetical protein
MKRTCLLLVTLLALASVACSDGGRTCHDGLMGPGCMALPPPAKPQSKLPASPELLPPAALEIASFSVLAVPIPGDDECALPYPCLVPVVDVVEETGVGRANVTSLTVVGYQLTSSCPVGPGQRVSLSPGFFWWGVDTVMGQEQTIVVTYDDGTGVVHTLSAKGLVQPGELPTSLSSCIGPAIPVQTTAAGRRPVSRTR